MADPNKSFTPTPESFGTVGRVLSPSANDLDPVAKSVVLLQAGDITILPVNNADGDTISFVNVPAGYSPPYRVRRVTAATAPFATVEG